MPRIVDLGITTYLWVPGASGIADPNAPTATELTAAGVKNLSQYVVTSTSVAPGSSDTTNEKSITDTSNVVVPTIGNYEGNLVLFRDFTSGAPATNDLLSTFANAGIVGWIVRRVGKASTVTVAAADLVDCFLFMTDNPQVMGGTGEGFLKLTVPLLQQGRFSIGKAVVA